MPIRTYGKGVRRNRAHESSQDLPRLADTVLKQELEDDDHDAHVADITERVQRISVTSHNTTEESYTHKSPGLENCQEAAECSHSTQSIDDSARDSAEQTSIEKLAEASFSEIYRVTNACGTSIMKCIRLESPIKAQTKTQQKSGLVDEEPHQAEDLEGELKISEWLADIPGFVVYKEQYHILGKAPKALLETHQAFHRKLKRQDPDRLQFYPSPSRYLDDTKFLAIELGDAGTALEDFELVSADQLWDILLHTAIALARAEDLVKFEHRDLHEGNLCLRQCKPPTRKQDSGPCHFGYSGLEVTMLDYGLSRAQDADGGTEPVSYDLEKDLGIFTSTHAPQCKVYRQMRTFLLHGDRGHLKPEHHTEPYAKGVDGRVSWAGHHPYTNVLWLAYIYRYLLRHFTGPKKELDRFRRETKELALHLDPKAPRHFLSFPSACDVVRFAAEAGWITQEQLMGERNRADDSGLHSLTGNASIFGLDSPRARRLPMKFPLAVADGTV